MPDGIAFAKPEITLPAILNLILFILFDSRLYDSLSILLTDYENHES